MGLFDVNYSFNNLIRTTSSGIETSTFVQIKNAITERYKEIYGNDIDVSTETADGQYIMMLALMMYNGYSSVKYLNQMLDPATATGKWLDVIAGFSNVFRNNASPSYAYVYVKYKGNTPNYTSNFGSDVQTIQFVDTNGKIWTWKEGKSVSGFKTQFNNTDYYSLKVVCEENGPISTFADTTVNDSKFEPSDDNLNETNRGDISKTVDESVFPFSVWQAQDAVLGNDDETDQSFRIRRVQEIGNGGVTVSNGLIGTLLEILGVQEAKIYENVTNPSGYNANDNTVINYHDIYLCVRYKENVNDSTIDDEIAKVIHNKLTLGIVTTPYLNSYSPSTVATPKLLELYTAPNTPALSSNTFDGTSYYSDEQATIEVSAKDLELIEQISSNLVNEYEMGSNDKPIPSGTYFNFLNGVSKKETIQVYDTIQYDIYWKKCFPIAPSLKLKFLRNQLTYPDGNSSYQSQIIDLIKSYTKSLTIYDKLVLTNLLSYLNGKDTPSNNQSNFLFTEGAIFNKGTDETYMAGTTYQDLNNQPRQEYNNEDTYYNYDKAEFVFDYTANSNATYIETIVYIYKK